MRKKTVLLTTLLACAATIGHAGIKGSSFGIVDFESCIEDSKFGKKEKESFDSLKNQMLSMLTDTERQLQDVSQKLSDQDYLDSLSPQGEDELKSRFQALSEEMNRYQNQFYQVLQQANMKMLNSMSSRINNASEVVAKDNKIPLILNKQAAFFYDEKFDITTVVIDQMNDSYETELESGKLAEAEQPNPEELLKSAPVDPTPAL